MPDQDQQEIRPRDRRLQLLFEVIAIVVLVGAVLWLGQNYRPRPFSAGG